MKLLSSSHYDIWTQGKISSTAIALDFDLLIGSIYYIIYYENNKLKKYLTLVLFAMCMFYCLFLGRRTQTLLFIICFVVLFVIDNYSSKRNFLKSKNIVAILVLLSLFILFVLACLLNLFNIRNVLNNFYIVAKFSQGLIDSSRVNLLVNTFKLMPKHLFGGQEISTLIGGQVHEFWLDIYDYAGIVPYIIMIFYSIYYLISVIRTLRKDKSSKLNLLYIGLLICIVFQLFLEPIMTGASIFLIVVIIVGTLIEGIGIDEK